MGRPIPMKPARANQVYRDLADRFNYSDEQISRLKHSPHDPDIRTAYVRGNYDTARLLASEVFFAGADQPEEET